MDAVKTQSTLDSFIKYVVQQSKSNLSKKDKNVSKQLYNSIDGKFKANKNSIEGYFQMEKYGEFQDKGVKGKFSSAKAPNSPFKFGSGTGKKGGLTNGIENWVTRRRLQFKDRQTGKFLTYKQTAFMITKSIYAKGMKPTEFFTRPFELAFKKLPDDLIEAYGLDVETFLKYTLKDNEKN
jgi:hypothetical protein